MSEQDWQRLLVVFPYGSPAVLVSLMAWRADVERRLRAWGIDPS